MLRLKSFLGSPISDNGTNGFLLHILASLKRRYIDSTEPEDLQDIDAHLRGGIPNRDIDALDAYWKVIPTLGQPYSNLAIVPATAI